MSGIVGVYHADGRLVDPSDLGQMMDTLRHRGPDGARVWCEGSVGFGHQMLHTTRESLHEVLPFLDREADLAITADARIDNREELFRRLELSGRADEDLSDIRLILAAYRKWGASCPSRLLGDFAFAIWDGRRKRLYCARDRVGVKPFYYYRSEESFVLGSEIKAILALSTVPRRLNESRIADFLVPRVQDQVGSFYRDICRLPPAHWLILESGRLEARSYWSPDPNRELRLASDDDYAEAFRDVFTTAVDQRLRCAFPTGSTLSGGLDSSSVACTAGKLLRIKGRKPLHTFSAVFPSVVDQDPRIDERPYVDAVLGLGLFAPHIVRADESRPIEDVAWHEDEAWPAPSLYMSRAILKEAHRVGVRALLSGFDGDSVLSHGYEYLDHLALNARWSDFAGVAKAIARRRPGVSARRYFKYHGLPYLIDACKRREWRSFHRQAAEVEMALGLSRKHLFYRAGIEPLLIQPVRRLGGFGNAAGGPGRGGHGLNRAINRAFARRVDLADRIRASEDRASEGSIREQLARGLHDGQFEFVANVLDHTAARSSIEMRYPFLDCRVIEFCLAIPLERRLRDGWPRAILRHAMAGILPEEVRWRTTKANLSANVRLRLLEERETVDQIVLVEPAPIEPYVDVGRLRATYQRFLAHPASASEEDLFTVFLATVLGIWLRRFHGLTEL